MKFNLVLTGLTALSLNLSAAATTLKLSADIDLMMVDGKKITSSLLKGADSLELGAGQHQLLFRVTKSVHKAYNTQASYASSPLLVVFDSQNVSSVAIELPRIESVRDGERFDDNPNYRVLDTVGQALPIKSDVLPLGALVDASNMERFVADYNSQNKKASLPGLVNIRDNTNATLRNTRQQIQKSSH